MADKKISPRDAAVAILNRAAELYKSSTLSKSEDLKKGDWKKIHDKLEREGYSKESADKIDGSIKAKLNKSDEMGNNPDAQADAQLGEKVEQDVAQHEAKNADPTHEAPMKGHIKLAKFVGAMEAKRGSRPGAVKEMDKGETGHEKGVATSVSTMLPGTSTAGIKATGTLSGSGKNLGDAKKDSIGRMMEQSQIKPKLPG